MSRSETNGLGYGGIDSAPLTLSTLESKAALWKRLAAIGPSRLCLGFPDYENLAEPTPHQYLLLGARPGMYKTTLAWNWAVNLAKTGKLVGWFGIEMSPDQMALWTISRLTGIPAKRLEAFGRGRLSLTSDEQKRKEEAEEVYDCLPIAQWGRRRMNRVELAEAIRMAPYDAIVVDYIGLVQGESSREREHERISEASTLLRTLKEELPIFVCALAQMNRSIENPLAKPRPPNLSDLKGSGQLEADGDVIAFLHRAQGMAVNQREVQLRIEKNRFGPLGVVDLLAHPEIKFVEEKPDPEEQQSTPEDERVVYPPYPPEQQVKFPGEQEEF